LCYGCQYPYGYSDPGLVRDRVQGGRGHDATLISRGLRTNRVVVRRILKSMKQHGLVEIRPGKDGGVQLARAPDGSTLDCIITIITCTLT
jgi:DNA-binding IscR family transcriptional regulator